MMLSMTTTNTSFCGMKTSSETGMALSATKTVFFSGRLGKVQGCKRFMLANAFVLLLPQSDNHGESDEGQA